MKQKLLLLFLPLAMVNTADAQKKSSRTTAYAITGASKGSRSWTEVNLVDLSSGEVISPVYQSRSQVQRLNARSGKPITLSNPKEASTATPGEGNNRQKIRAIRVSPGRVRTEDNTASGSSNTVTRVIINNAHGTRTITTTEPRIMTRRRKVDREQPFATTSAACALDKKHDRLYYTPLGLNELRYIDLKAKTPTVYYFEGEAFGKAGVEGNVGAQITRMVIASDGKGYALTNNAEHLIQFTTKKKPVITDLGSLTDDASNRRFSIHSSDAYGGDLVADKSENIYLITANRRVYKISLETRNALYLGSIRGLPEGFTTNGAVVDEDNGIIVTSSQSTKGYYRFTLDNLNAEKISANEYAFNASDLANENLLSIKKKKREEQKPEEEKAAEVLAREKVLGTAVDQSIRSLPETDHSLSVYPNPISGSTTRLSMNDYPEGRYEVQLLDLSGKQLNRQVVQLNNKVQQSDFNLPRSLAKGTYLLRVVNSGNVIMDTEKIIVQ